MLDGGAGDDTLDGGEGNDALTGGAGVDVLAGGAGDDTYFASLADGDVIIDDVGGNALSLDFGGDPTTLLVSQSPTDPNTMLVSDTAGHTLEIRNGFVGSIAEFNIDGQRYTPAEFLSTVQLAALTLTGSETDEHLVGGAQADTLDGRGGNDTIEGLGADDTLIGGTGDDVLRGGEGADLLIGGAGQDTLAGEAGADTYRLGFGMGLDTWIDLDQNAILLDGGLAFSDLAASRAGDDLLLTVRGASDGARLKDYFVSSPAWTIRDADGAETTADQVLADTAARAADWRQSLKDDFTAQTKAAAMAPLLSAGFVAAANGEWRRDQFGSFVGLQTSSFNATKTVFTFTAGHTSEILSSSSTQQWNAGLADWTRRDAWRLVSERIETDAPSIGYASGVQGVLDSSASGAETVAVQWTPRGLPATSQSTYTAVFPGTYPFLYTSSTSLNISSVQYYTGTVTAVVGGPPSPASQERPPYVSLPWASETGRYIFREIVAGASDNFIDGGTIVEAGAGNDTVTSYGGLIFGGTGDDALFEGAVMAGEDGDDVLTGGWGATRFIVGALDAGADRISDLATVDAERLAPFYYPTIGLADWRERLPLDPSSEGRMSVEEAIALGILPALPRPDAYGTLTPFFGAVSPDTAYVEIPIDTLEFSPGLTAADLAVAWDATSPTLVLSAGGRERARLATPVRRNDWGYGIEQVRFADGSALGIGELFALAGPRTFRGTEDADTISGTEFDDIFSASVGDDTLIGDLGSDVYHFGLGSGQDTIEDWRVGGTDLNVVVIDAGITPAQLSVTLTDTHLVLAIEGTEDQLEIRWDPVAGFGVQRVEFQGGTVWNEATLQSLVTPPVTVVTGTSTAETLTGTEGPDTISGLGGDDVLVGLGSADRLDGGAGADQMSGGPGDDRYVVNDAGDQVLEADGDGTDLVEASVSFTLPAAVENLTLTGAANLSGTGNALANVLTGNSGNNTLDGGDSDDVLAGGAGVDTLLGGTGDDTFLVNGDEGPDTFNGGDGFDLVLGGAGDDVFRVANFSGANTVEWIDGGAGTNTIAGTAANNTLDLSGTFLYSIALIDGGAGNDAITGSAGNDTILGGLGADTLRGGAGDDTFLIYGTDTAADTVGGDAGFDAILGSAGDDTFRFSSYSGANTAERIDGGGGVNTIAGTAANNTIDLSGTEILNIALIDGGAGNDAITGSTGDDTLRGGLGADTLSAGDGDDTFLIDGDEGPDTFDGGEGVDTVLGGAGDDVIRVASLYAGNAVERIDGGGGYNVLAGTAGNNTIDVSAIELLNIALIDGGAGNDAITGSLLNDRIRGGAGADTLLGGAGDDTFLVVGDEGPDTFDGGSGFDTVLGSAGDDVIRVASFGPTNAVERIDGGGGVNTIAGTAGNNTIDLSAIELLNVALVDGGAGNDTITGTAGNDAIRGGAGTDTLLGGAGDDTFLVTGDEGPDTFDGGSGFDTVLGSAGDDVIRVASFSAANAVERIDGGGGTNIVAGTAANNTIDLSATNLVAVALIDGGAGNDAMTGSAGNDTIQGGLGADTLRGGAGEDTFLIVGTDSAADTVGGDAGFDAILGSAGDDTFRFSSYSGANAVERIDGGGGVDTIAGTAGNNTLDLSATELVAIGRIDGGTGNDTVTGSAAADFITGGDGTDTLRGEGGNDLVQGGLGNDSLTDTGGANLLDGGAGTDSITGGTGAEFIAGGTGNDTVNPGAGADVLAFNAGDGQDTVNPGSGANKSLSLGGGIRYEDLAFRKSANDLVLETSATASLTLKNWYAAPANQQFVTLQVIAEAMAGFSQSSPDPLRDDKVETFSFAALAAAFDAARAADAMITRWTLMNALLDAHLAGSDDAALGGDLAYQYGLNGTLAGIGTGAAQDVVGASQFGTQPQQLRPLATLQEGLVKLS